MIVASAGLVTELGGDFASLPGRVLLWVAIFLIGAELAAWCSGSRRRGLAWLAWDGAAGLSITMAALLWLGRLPGGFGRSAFLALFAALAVVAAIARWRRTRRRRETEQDTNRDAPWPIAAIALVGFVAVAGLVWNRVPAVFFDTLTYHFANPNLWLVEGRATPLEWSLHSWFPPGASLLYGVGLAFGGDVSANDANLLAALALLGLVFETTRRLWDDASGMVAAVLLVTLPIYGHAVGIAGADLIHGLFGFGAVACWAIGRERRDETEWLPRAALFVAGAILTKYLAVLVPAALVVGLFAAWPADRRRTFALAVRSTAILVLPGVLMLSPWLLANANVAGSALAPIFAAPALAEGGAARFQEAARGGMPDVVDLADLGHRLFTGDADESTIYPTPIWGWVPALLLPLAVVYSRRDRRVRALLALTAVGFVVWLLTYRWERFLIAVTALMVVALGGSIRDIWRRGGLVGRSVVVAIGLIVALTTLRTGLEVLRFTGGAGVALGSETSQQFLARSRAAEFVYQEANRRLDPTRHRILVLGEVRHHRLDLPHVAPGVFNRHPWMRQAVATRNASAPNGELTRRLIADGFTHLLVNSRGATASSGYPSLAALAEDPGQLERYLGTLGAALAARGGVALYALDPLG